MRDPPPSASKGGDHEQWKGDREHGPQGPASWPVSTSCGLFDEDLHLLIRHPDRGESDDVARAINDDDAIPHPCGKGGRYGAIMLIKTEGPAEILVEVRVAQTT